MTYKFATPLDVETIGTNGVLEIGNFVHDGSCEIKYVMVHLLKDGVAGGSESLRIRVHTSDNYARIYAQSEPRLLSDFTSETSFIGWLRFDFDRENIVDGQTYYLTLEATNYTEDVDNYYLAAVFDSPFDMNEHTEDNIPPSNCPKAFKIIGYK